MGRSGSDPVRSDTVDVVLQSRTPKYGLGRHYPKTAAGHGRVACLLLVIAKKGGITGVPAYSTLGWFADPVLSSMLHWDDATLISTLFHELAHQVLYIRHDTAFNESFARFVEQQGLREYLASGAQITPPDPIRRARHQQFVALVLSARDELATLYARAMPVEAMRAQKAHIFEALRARYQTLRDSAWQGDPRYDAWFEKLKTNNARLLPFGLYDALVPAFAALFDEVQGDWPRFYAASQALSELPADQRQARIEGLMQRQAKKPAQQALAGD
ncbi:aminopeptidase [Sinimarinibacterium sp. NLF-5-8]|nr:aminopeptidase [Sinimarinibacterium sp. NLF-5-8]